MYQIYCKSNFYMNECDSESIALTVTSPPYFKSINYNTHTDSKNNENYRKGDYATYGDTLDDYFTNLKKSFMEVIRVTIDGGFCAVVMGTVLVEKKHIPLPAFFTTLMLDIGWDFHQNIVWNKITGGVKRAGVFIQHPYQGYYYPNIMHEDILIFRKPGEIRRGKKQELQIDSLFTRDIANSIWHVAPVPPKSISHPCPFPDEIVRRLILLYSQKDDAVLDPFVGSGQTALAALRLDRHFVGYDTISEYIELSKGRIANPPPLREHNLIPKIEKLKNGNS